MAVKLNFTTPVTVYSPSTAGEDVLLTYPRIVELTHSGEHNGTLLAIGETLEVPFYKVFRSTDGGETWNYISEVKEQLASEAIKYIVPGDTIFLDASTTTFYLAKELKSLKNVTVITNSLRVIQELSDCPDLKVIAVGGHVSNNQSLVGNLAEQNISHYFFADKMFFSSRGLSKSGGILESNEQEFSIKAKMLKNSKEKFYLCDNSKLERIDFAKLAQLEEIDTVISNGEFDDEWCKLFEESNVTLVKA